MFLLLSYDIDQSDNGKRLRNIAKICEKYGVRVQGSVFELEISSAQLMILKSELEKALDPSVDSVRIYKIGRHNKADVEILGRREKIEITVDSSFLF